MAEDSFILDPSVTAYMKSDAFSSAAILVKRAFAWIFSRTATEAAAASTTAVLGAVTDTGASQDITSGITNPPCARNITATAGGTSADVKAISVTVYGTNLNDEAISESIGPFTVNTTGTVTGNKAFKTVNRIVIPAHDGTGATTSIGFGDKLGLPIKLSENTNFRTHLGGTLEGTAATVVTSTSALESNTIDLNSALNGSAVKAWFLTV